MKKVILYCIGMLVLGCNTEDGFDCFQNSGDLVRDIVAVPDFTQITVFENVQLVLRQGPETEVMIETGEFLRSDVSAVVDGDRLVLRDENGCNLFRDFGLTTIFVTAPNITEIRSSTGFPIRSEGTLSYSNLTLLSESFIDETAETTDGEFDLDLDAENLSVVVNGIAFFQLRGTVENVNITIAAGDSRIEAESLVAQNVMLNHRGSNAMFVNPQQSLRGVIRGNGDVISVNEPPIVEVEEIFRGRLIFRD